jgi:cysteine-rich repeat protein
MEGSTRFRVRPVSSVFALAVILLATSRAGAQCPDPNSFCTGSTCTVGGPVTVSDGCVLAWGTGKTVTIAAAGSISVAAGGSFTLTAPTLNVDGLLSAPGGSITIATTGQFQNRNSGHIEANGLFDDVPGTILITGSPLLLVGTSHVTANGLGGMVDVCGGTRDVGDNCQRNGAVTINATPAAGDAAITVGGNEDAQVTIHGSTISIGAGALVRANAAELTGIGGTVDIHASTSVSISGSVQASNSDADTSNASGSGGAINVVADATGTITITSTGVLTAEGGNDAEDSADGSISIGPACAIVLNGKVDSDGGTRTGTNSYQYRGTFNAAGGKSEAGTTADGTNTIDCRKNAAGTACASPPTNISNPKWDPDPTITPQNFGPCTGCGNGVVEGAEACDDGNLTACDSCSPTCTVTNPHASCNDGNACTVNDICDGAGHCRGPVADCDDGNPCTQDSCASGSGCGHVANVNCQYQLIAPSPITDFGAHIGTSEGQPLASVGSDIAVTGPLGVTVYDGTSGALKYSLTDPDPGDGGDFGRAVGSVGSKLLVGAPGGIGSDPGRLYVFAGATGTLLQTIQNPSSGSYSSAFGWSVAGLGTNTVVAGTPVDDTTGTVLKGAAFGTDATSGALVASYLAPPESSVQAFGWSVATLGTRVVVGGIDGWTSPWNEVMVFSQTGGSPLLTIPTPFPIEVEVDLFGESVGLLSTPSGVPNVLVADRDSNRAWVFNGTSGAVLYQFAPGPSESLGYPVAAVAGNAVVGVSPAQARLYNGFSGAFIQNLTAPAGSTFVVMAARNQDILVGGDTGVNVYRTRCGNGIKEAGEACDDGNTRDDDCCTSTCQLGTLNSPCNTGNPCAPGVCTCGQPGGCFVTHVCVEATCLVGMPCAGGGTCGGTFGSCMCQ